MHRPDADNIRSGIREEKSKVLVALRLRTTNRNQEQALQVLEIAQNRCFLPGCLCVASSQQHIRKANRSFDHTELWKHTGDTSCVKASVIPVIVVLVTQVDRIHAEVNADLLHRLHSTLDDGINFLGLSAPHLTDVEGSRNLGDEIVLFCLTIVTEPYLDNSVCR